jgi:hypothetical protein
MGANSKPPLHLAAGLFSGLATAQLSLIESLSAEWRPRRPWCLNGIYVPRLEKKSAEECRPLTVERAAAQI